ncbi:hypothetical protein [Streptomyces sp. Root264]|uniref:aromatic-ring hydroxylase C-terminal domain-containing protein n=1 Tax=Streptomyces sp. Root264 TaxID=1736503 RepID=UPI000708CD2D|nr:hypothetical protein [Streptomyces sp. Root264]KRD24662.1 hypothetical protein ASE41_02555 [Streptomyces sp. Root264]
MALRNRQAAARHALVRAATMTANRAELHSERWLGARTRQRVGREILDLGNLENEALGIELGYRYDSSPVVCPDTAPGARAPRRTMDEYVPSTWPGARPPSVLLADGTALFDLFHTAGSTLLRFADHDVTALTDAATERGVPLKVVDVRDPHAHALCERDLVLVRPDQHIAWRGDTAPTDHGYWPSSPTVGTMIPPSWRCDGVAEVRFGSTTAALGMPMHMREVYLDEQNVFERVLGQVTGPGCGRWWTDGHDDAVGHRTVLLLRRRRGVGGRTFRRFVHDRIGPALQEAAAQDLRTYNLPAVVAVRAPHARRLSRQPDLPPLSRERRRLATRLNSRAADSVRSDEVDDPTGQNERFRRSGT